MILAPRYIPRLAATIGLFTRYGLADFAKQQGLKGIAPEPGDEDSEGPSPEKASAFRKRLVELGPAYIKLGQVLSTRPDLLPPVYIQELEKLQDDVGEIPFADVERIIEEELQGRISKLFSEFSEEPLGSASLGQVHAAALRDGRSVVVKVQRPHIRAARRRHRLLSTSSRSFSPRTPRPARGSTWWASSSSSSARWPTSWITASRGGTRRRSAGRCRSSRAF